MLLLVSAMLDACVAPCVCVCVYSTKCVESAVGTGFCGAFLACLTAAGQPQASRRCLTAAGQPQASRTSLLTLFSRSTEIPGPSLLTLFARSTEIPVKAGASQLGKKHPARLLGRHARTRQSSAGERDDDVYWYSFSNHYTKRAFTQP